MKNEYTLEKAEDYIRPSTGQKFSGRTKLNPDESGVFEVVYTVGGFAMLRAIAPKPDWQKPHTAASLEDVQKRMRRVA